MKTLLRVRPFLPLAILAAAALAPAPSPARDRPGYEVVIPDQKLPFPTPFADGRTEPGFKLRGTKGWAWTWDQYLAEIPTLIQAKMNFLMSCYTCVFTDKDKFDNRWWEPFSDQTKDGIGRLARACRESGITFCFSFHPALFTTRPLRTDSDKDFEDMWNHYAWVQSLGVRWFSLSYDDIETKGQDPSALGAAHAGLANRLLRRLREKDPRAELVFCPVYYWGCGGGAEAGPYLEALGRALNKDAFLFWTGDAVVTQRITRACAESFKRKVRHRLIIWDNYPVNDRSNALHLGPITGRDPDLDAVAYGYMSNPLCPQNEINRLPLLTCADYAYNPRAYDPARSIGQAVLLQADTPARRRTLKDLIELYPGNLLSGSSSTAYNCVLERFRSLLEDPGARENGPAFIDRVAGVAARLDSDFPGRYAETKKTMAAHIAQMGDEFRKKYPGASGGPSSGTTVRLSKAALQDKIRGGWAGKTIGCTYGGPTEFRFQGTIIWDYTPIRWSENEILNWYKNGPGLYDDVYMNLTFVDVFQKRGLDAPAAEFARAFAAAPYPLWHANQMARSNILRGLLPPASGHWLNNPHADDIDFQIEADFAGLMAPGLPAAAAEFCDRVGHIMNYGDGWYGGLYVATMLSLAFVSDDVPWIVGEALEAVPAGSAFAQTMRDVIKGWRADPADWKKTWFAVTRRWAEDVGCPDGVFSPFDIDAKINCAWVILGLLYGGGDFGRTIDIAARCGDDSDCNPSTAGGILGAVLGYEGIPEVWRKALVKVEDLPFPYVNLSLRQAYDSSYRQALAVIEKAGGTTGGEEAAIPFQAPQPQKLEVGFAGHYPIERRRLNEALAGESAFEFSGIGFALSGEARAPGSAPLRYRVEMRIDGVLAETIELPTAEHDRRETIAWKYALPAGRHTVRLKWMNPPPGGSIHLGDVVIYGEAPASKK
ncbi:MAG: beta-N-acetylglucosaminidase domain-containing protein [Candidatus Aminicenantales bacterium]|jgi:hypothetical protein